MIIRIIIIIFYCLNNALYTYYNFDHIWTYLYQTGDMYCNYHACMESSIHNFFLIQFYVPFNIISAHMRRVNQ